MNGFLLEEDNDKVLLSLSRDELNRVLGSLCFFQASTQHQTLEFDTDPEIRQQWGLDALCRLYNQDKGIRQQLIETGIDALQKLDDERQAKRKAIREHEGPVALDQWAEDNPAEVTLMVSAVELANILTALAACDAVHDSQHTALYEKLLELCFEAGGGDLIP